MTTRAFEVRYESDELDYGVDLEVEVELTVYGDRDDSYVVVGKMSIDGHEVRLTTLENEIEEDGDLVEDLILDNEYARADYLYDLYNDR